MNNEPVAWMAVNELNGSYSTFTNDQKQRLLPHVSQCYGKWIPLYTHPVNPYQSITNTKIEPTVVSYTHPVKDLTDEEIMKLYDQDDLYNIDEGQMYLKPIEFARAILRKAQEK